MKKIFILLILAFLFIGCSNSTYEVTLVTQDNDTIIKSEQILERINAKGHGVYIQTHIEDIGDEKHTLRYRAILWGKLTLIGDEIYCSLKPFTVVSIKYDERR